MFLIIRKKNVLFLGHCVIGAKYLSALLMINLCQKPN